MRFPWISMGCLILLVGCQSVSLPELDPPKLLSATQTSEDPQLQKFSQEVFATHPLLRSSEFAVKAAEGRVQQAGLLPNPELEGDVEELGGKDELKGFKAALFTLTLNQELPIFSGRLTYQQSVAQWEKLIREWELQLQKLKLWQQVSEGYFKLLWAKEQYALSVELWKVAKGLKDTIAAKVKAGKVSPLEENTATVELARAEVERRRAQNLLEAAEKQFAILLGRKLLPPISVENFYKLPAKLPTLEQCFGFVEKSPQMVLQKLQQSRQRAVIRLEDSRAIPDPSVMGGVQYLRENKSHAFTFGFALPLPLFDRNQGERKAAMFELQQLEAGEKALRRELLQNVSGAYEELRSLWREAQTLAKVILPQTKRNLDSARDGYMQGKFSYLRVLEAQRTFFEVRRQYLDVLLNYHLRRSELESLLGRKLAK